MSEKSLRIPDYLDHILEALRRIRGYTENFSEASFLRDTLVQDAVVRNIEIIGEASRNVERVAPDFARLHPDVPWALIYAMRNRVAHGYFSVDLAVVWRTICDDFPALEQRVLSIRNTFGHNNQ